MIYLYYGKIGDGKTYHVVANELLPALASNRKVYTNIDGLNKKHIAMLLGKLETELHIVHLEHAEAIKDLMQLAVDDKAGHSLKIEKGSIVIIDEAQMVWDAREFKDTKKSFLSLLEYHRHFGLDFVFITQNPKRLEASITRLANESYQIKNLRFLGAFLKNRYVLHVRQTPFDREIISTIRGKYRSEIFLCYRSYVSSSKFNKKSKSALQGFFYYATAIVFVLSIALFIIKGGFTFANPDKIKSLSNANINTKGGQNVNSNTKIPDFIYDNNSSQKSLEVSSKKSSLDIIAEDECQKYRDIRGNNYIRRANVVIYKDNLGVWRNKDISCSSNDTIDNKQS